MFLYKFLRNLFIHIKYQRIINAVYKKEQIIAKISSLLGTQFRLDWIKRLYGVINPNIKDGKYNPEQIYEFDTEGNMLNTEWIVKWIVERLSIMKNFIQVENLFDVLEYQIKDLGELNYLVVFQSVTLSPVLKSIKPAIIELVLLVTIAIGLYIFL